MSHDAGAVARAGRRGAGVVTPFVPLRSAVRALAILDIVLVLAGGLWSPLTGGSDGAANAVSAALFVLFPVVALVIVRARRATAIAAVFAISSLLYGIQKLGDLTVTTGLRDGWAPTLVRGAAWASNVAWFPSLVLLVTVALLRFPDGRLLSPRWRLVEVVTLVAMVVWSVGLSAAALTVPVRVLVSAVEPLPPPGLARVLFEVSEPALLVMLCGAVASFASLFVRHRRGGPVERAQIRWVLTAAASAIVIDASLLVHAFAVGGGTPFWVQNLGEGLGFGLIAVATGIAITRHRLYEIDRIISRTVTYAVVLVVLAGTYTVVLVAASTVVPARFGPIGVAGATLLVSLVAAPVTRAVRRAVDQRFNRTRFDAERVAASFATRLRASPGDGDVSTDLLVAVQRTIQPAHATVWLLPVRGAVDPH